MLSKVKKRWKCLWPKQHARPKNEKRQDGAGKSTIRDGTKDPDRSILALLCVHTTVYLYENTRTSLKNARVSDFDLVRTPPRMPKVSISLRTSSKIKKVMHDAFKVEENKPDARGQSDMDAQKTKKRQILESNTTIGQGPKALKNTILD